MTYVKVRCLTAMPQKVVTQLHNIILHC